MSISYLFKEDVSNIRALLDIGKSAELSPEENDAIENYALKRSAPMKPLLRYDCKKVSKSLHGKSLRFFFRIFDIVYWNFLFSILFQIVTIFKSLHFCNRYVF